MFVNSRQGIKKARKLFGRELLMELLNYSLLIIHLLDLKTTKEKIDLEQEPPLDGFQMESQVLKQDFQFYFQKAYQKTEFL